MAVGPYSPPVHGDGIPAKHSGEDNRPIDRLVVHSAVMPCEPGRRFSLGEMNQRGSGGGSWHYAIDPAGVLQCSYDRFVCWAAPPNGNSLEFEMADYPGPVPNEKRGTARWKALKRSWRWARPEQDRMLKHTARAVAHSAVYYGVPIRFVGVRGLRAGKRGITTHAKVSLAFRQSTHWDPGWWPQRRFMHLVRKYAKQIRQDAA